MAMQAQTNLRDFAIPEEMYSCHINELFDLLALRTVEFITDVRRWAISEELIDEAVGFQVKGFIPACHAQS